MRENQELFAKVHLLASGICNTTPLACDAHPDICHRLPILRLSLQPHTVTRLESGRYSALFLYERTSQRLGGRTGRDQRLDFARRRPHPLAEQQQQQQQQHTSSTPASTHIHNHTHHRRNGGLDALPALHPPHHRRLQRHLLHHLLLLAGDGGPRPRRQGTAQSQRQRMARPDRNRHRR